LSKTGKVGEQESASKLTEVANYKFEHVVIIYRSILGFGWRIIDRMSTAELDLYSPMGLKLQLSQDVEMAGTAGSISPAIMSKPILADKM